MNPKMRDASELRWALVDLDGTLAESVFDPRKPTSLIGPAIEENVTKAKNLVAQGFKLVIYTSRPSVDHEYISIWLDAHDIEYDHIITGKPLGAIYIDDKAVNASAEEWKLP